MKLQSAKCQWCAGNCLLWVRCLRWYCCEAVDSGGSSWCSVVWIVHDFTKQLIVTLLQQLAKFQEVGRAEAASLTAAQKLIYSLAVCRTSKTAPRGWRICQTEFTSPFATKGYEVLKLSFLFATYGPWSHYLKVLPLCQMNQQETTKSENSQFDSCTLDRV